MITRITLIGFLLSVFMSQAYADEVTQIMCRDGNNGPGNTVMFWAKADSLDTVGTNDALQVFLTARAKEAWQKCTSGGYATSVARFLGIATVVVPGNGNPEGVARGMLQAGGNVWAVTYFDTFEQTKKEIRDKIASAQQERQQKADAAALSQKLQADFKAQTGTEMWVSPQALKANPFPYKDKTVGMMETFQQMIGDGQAMFGANFDVIVTGVPNTMFTQPGTAAIIAIQVQGVRQFQMLGTNMALATGVFKGAYMCKSRDCAEIVGPH